MILHDDVRINADNDAVAINNEVYIVGKDHLYTALMLIAADAMEGLSFDNNFKVIFCNNFNANVYSESLNKLETLGWKTVEDALLSAIDSGVQIPDTLTNCIEEMMEDLNELVWNAESFDSAFEAMIDLSWIRYIKDPKGLLLKFTKEYGHVFSDGYSENDAVSLDECLFGNPAKGIPSAVSFHTRLIR